MTQSKWLLIIIFLTAFICRCKEKEVKSDLEIIEEKENAELATGKRNDTIFLGFCFGMTEEQVNEKFDELEENKKIYLDSEYRFHYDFTFDYPKKATASFLTEYYNGKLFKMTLHVKSDEVITSKSLQLRFVLLFCDKYGWVFINIKSILGTKDNDFDYIWIQGNRKIEVRDLMGITGIFYTDIVAERELEESEKIKLQQKINETKKDL